jgi:hypothetical protein
MMRIASAVAVVLLLTSTFPAAAHFGLLVHPCPTKSYYYAVPVIPTPLYVTPAPVVCVPVVMPRPVAQPQAAPPSTEREPPLIEPTRPVPQSSAKPANGPQQHRSRYFDTYAVAPSATTRPNSPRCSVSFWNLSSRDLVLKVGTQSLTLACGRSATLDLEREFTWKIDGREAESGRVAANESALEIIIRR